MDFLQAPNPVSFQTVPIDYGYLVTFLVGLVGVLFTFGFAGIRYVVIQADKREAARIAEFKQEKEDQKAEAIRRENERKSEWRDAEAAKVEARHRLEGTVNTRIDKLEHNTEAFFREMEARDRTMQGRTDDIDKRLSGLEELVDKRIKTWQRISKKRTTT